MSDVPARVVAATDQEDARVAELVRVVRHHHETGCDRRDICISEAWTPVTDLSHLQARQLLRAALIRLARTPDPHAWP